MGQRCTLRKFKLGRVVGRLEDRGAIQTNFKRLYKHLGCHTELWASPSKKDAGRVGSLYEWATRSARGTAPEGRGEGKRTGLVQPEEKAGILLLSPNTSQGHRDSAAWLFSKGQSGKRRSNGCRYKGILIRNRKFIYLFICGVGWSDTDTGCQERLWNIRPWRHSKLNKSFVEFLDWAIQSDFIYFEKSLKVL